MFGGQPHSVRPRKPSASRDQWPMTILDSATDWNMYSHVAEA
jgi:hypothetical protein